MIEAVRDSRAGANSSGEAPSSSKNQRQGFRVGRRPLHRLLLESTALVGFTITAAAALPAVALITGLATTQAYAAGGNGGGAGGGAGGQITRPLRVTLEPLA
jgi:hypothetical protein